MRAVLMALVAALTAAVRSRAALCIEVLLHRHQLAVYRRRPRRPRLRPAGRVLWAWLARRWSQWRAALVMAQPRTVIARQRRRFRDHWTRPGHRVHPGRPPSAREMRAPIHELSSTCPTWGSPRIVGELRRLGLAVANRPRDR